MTSAVQFARKEVAEILRTWRIYVLPAIFALFALSGPLLAKFTTQLLTAVGGDQFAAFQLPEPTVFDSYGQWIKNLSQIAMFAIIIIYGGLVSSERRSGTAVLVLSKPVSRTAFVTVKAAVHVTFVAVLLVIGTALTWAVTAIVFHEAPAGPLWGAALVWLVLAVLYLCAMTLFSVLIPSAAGAAGAGLGLYVLLSIAGIWHPLASHSPAGLMTASTTMAAGGHAEALAWPIATSLALSVVAVGAAALLFRRQEL